MLVSGAGLLAASSLASSQTPDRRRGGILKFSLFAGIQNIDPQRSGYLPEWHQSPVYELDLGRLALR
jgi:hypothetical protein